MTSLTAVAMAWLEAWNAHDMDAIMSHYDDDIEFYSPVIVRINNDPAGRIKGKAALRSYFERALQAYPDLHFELYHVLEGMSSVVLYYKSVNNSLSAELMVLNEKGLVQQVRAHYKAMS
ncbi:nuclear transport factor 2 family protein [Chitinophaga sp. Cy-1792]|uniref:nuclear transport factor 2 family protein n=1 Tax=Chitinophaga sp. Cy-1792 TaxID=2608339 RepID=UPI001421E817|nr:nuclear transport factor 2 family protein [Chitinophaga sp. Cy-1792]NIG52912.1 nuclear transport factor 2 family protein [Chitinophaga sp. Cy-1792]